MEESENLLFNLGKQKKGVPGRPSTGTLVPMGTTLGIVLCWDNCGQVSLEQEGRSLVPEGRREFGDYYYKTPSSSRQTAEESD